MIKESTKKNIIQFGGYILFMWGVFVASIIFPIMKGYGIHPRSIMGLVGIITAPFLHANLNHIIGNTIALITFAPLFIVIVGERAIEKLIVLTLATGALTWLIAFPGNHIGASGLIFGLYGYLILLGFVKKNFKYLFVSIGLLVVYGYMIFGVLPNQAGISWESHLAGFISGAGFAKYKA